MNREVLFEKVQEIFRDIFDDDKLIITSSTNAMDIEEWDSLNQINLVVSFEKEFNIKFNFLELADLENVGDMINLIEKKINK